MRGRADALGFEEGAEWTEEVVGTNAIGTALAEASPVQLFSAEHFEAEQHPWYCTAAPIHDPRTGELLGIVDVSGPAMTLHPAIIALVETAVRLAESQLWRHHELRLERLRQAAAPVLASVAGPMLLVDDHGWVAHTAGIAAQARIAVPRDRRPLTVPGLGLCLPEPLGRRLAGPARGRRDRIVMALDLTGPPAVVVSGEQPWRSPLTARHAEILLLLHRAGRSGLSAAALSRGLYGDAEHVGRGARGGVPAASYARRRGGEPALPDLRGGRAGRARGGGRRLSRLSRAAGPRRSTGRAVAPGGRRSPGTAGRAGRAR